MKKEHLELLMTRVATWPESAQKKFARMLENFEANDVGLDPLTAEEKTAVEEGLAQAERGEFVSDDDMESLLNRPWR